MPGIPGKFRGELHAESAHSAERPVHVRSCEDETLRVEGALQTAVHSSAVRASAPWLEPGGLHFVLSSHKVSACSAPTSVLGPGQSSEQKTKSLTPWTFQGRSKKINKMNKKNTCQFDTKQFR